MNPEHLEGGIEAIAGPGVLIFPWAHLHTVGPYRGRKESDFQDLRSLGIEGFIGDPAGCVSDVPDDRAGGEQMVFLGRCHLRDELRGRCSIR